MNNNYCFIKDEKAEKLKHLKQLKQLKQQQWQKQYNEQIKNPTYHTPLSFSVNEIYGDRYDVFCQTCKKKLEYLNCSFSQRADISIHYKCFHCDTIAPVKEITLKSKRNYY